MFMKLFKISFLLFSMLAVVALTGCKKEGCMDQDATNYSPDAKKDDGTCAFTGEVVIWYGEGASDGLISDGATSLTFLVDGEIVGSTSSSVFWTAAPTCGSNASITISKDLGNAKNKSYTYSVEDQTGYVYWTGILNFTANSCESVQLVW
jgi:hypothetical protein